MSRLPTSVRPGDRIEVEATELVAGGDSLARHEGLPIFIPDLVPGDLALVEITEMRKGFGRGRSIEIRRPSTSRREVRCVVADECGGCDWTSLRLDAQLGAKRRILVESLRRTGGFDVDALPPIRLHPSPLNYRIRSRLHISRDPETGSPTVGFFARGSHRVVPLAAECEVVGRRTLAALTELAAIDTTSVLVFEVEDEVVVAGADDAPVEIHLRVLARIGSIRRVFDYRLTSHSFFQVNRHLLSTLLTLLADLGSRCSDRSAALDLYAGVGFFTLPLASIFERVVAVEEAEQSRAWAELNTRSAGNVDVIVGRVEQVLQGCPAAPFVFADPPRAGLHADAVKAIDRIATEMICYLSCDPVTFSRDAARLARRGWHLLSLDLVDLFPNTHHLETLGAFSRESRP